MKIYMLGYKAKSGKDTLAEMMVKRLGYTRYAFADKLKSMSADLFDLSEDQVHGFLKEAVDSRYEVNGTYLTPRYIFQTFGTEVARSIYPDIWSLYVSTRILNSTHKNYVITDFRFPNEYDVVKRVLGSYYDVITVEIFRSGRPNVAPHVSETALDNFPFDTKIINDGTVEDLYSKWLEYDGRE